MEEADVCAVFKALASPSRLRIVRLLLQRSFCVHALTSRLSISQPAVSQHLAVLKDAGLVTDDRSGTKVHYTLNRERLAATHRAFADLCAEADRKETV